MTLTVVMGEIVPAGYMIRAVAVLADAHKDAELLGAKSCYWNAYGAWPLSNLSLRLPDSYGCFAREDSDSYLIFCNTGINGCAFVSGTIVLWLNGIETEFYLTWSP